MAYFMPFLHDFLYTYYAPLSILSSAFCFESIKIKYLFSDSYMLDIRDVIQTSVFDGKFIKATPKVINFQIHRDKEKLMRKCRLKHVALLFSFFVGRLFVQIYK